MNPKGSTMYVPRDPDADTRVKAGVGVIVVDAAGRILLERRSDNGMWGLPGGAIEAGESVRQATLREVQEETGLKIRITGLLGVYSDPVGRIVTYPDNGDVAQLVDIVLTAKIVSGKLTLSQESLELKFFPPDSLPPEIVPPARQPIQDFINGRTGNIS
jgi:ADP-ribose pyrophosphatase YjhB (NUDIX family)